MFSNVRFGRLVIVAQVDDPGLMVRDVAVLSDIHGVLPVLEAVLAEPDVTAADLIVVTGDHAAGPQPSEVLDRLLALGDRVLLVRGNADRELVALAKGEPSTVGEAYPIDLWAAQQLSTTHLELLAGLPRPGDGPGRRFRAGGVLPRHAPR